MALEQSEALYPSVSREILDYWEHQNQLANTVVYERPLPLGSFKLLRQGFRVDVKSPGSKLKVCAAKKTRTGQPSDQSVSQAILNSSLEEAPVPKFQNGDFETEDGSEEGDALPWFPDLYEYFKQSMDNDTPFGTLSDEPGLQMWRVESLKPVKRPVTGTLFCGDCYIFLSVHETSSGRLRQDIHFWIGAAASQDEIGGAAVLATQLDGLFGGSPTIHRHVQDHESEEFLQMFSDLGGLRYTEGGVESGFRKASASDAPSVLLRVSGNRALRISEAELSVESLSSSDCFVLDLSTEVIQWNGKAAKPKTRMCALDVAVQQRDEAHGGGIQISFVDEGDVSSGAALRFFAALGCSDPVSAEIRDCSAEAQPGEPQPVKLFQVEDAELEEPRFMEVAAGEPLDRGMLRADGVHVLDTGAAIYVWIGSRVELGVRRRCLDIGTRFLERRGCAPIAQVKVIKSRLEPPTFKQHFLNWMGAPPVPTEAAAAVSPMAASPPPQDLAAIVARSDNPEGEAAEAAALGKATVWLVRDFDLLEWPEDRLGEFYDGDSFVILNAYDFRGSVRHIVYFWQGRNSSIGEKGASALLARKVDDDLSGDAAQVRVLQNKEPGHFLRLFKGGMVVHSGSAPDDLKPKPTAAAGARLFHCKSTGSPEEARAVEVDAGSAKLSSRDAYVLVGPGGGDAFAWLGAASSAAERRCAQQVADRLAGGAGSVAVEEGAEPGRFWEAMGVVGREGAEAAEDGKDAEASEGPEPRLFLLSDAKTGGRELWFEEIYNFSQDDLIRDDVMLLDAEAEVFLWVGTRASPNERERAEAAARRYLEASDAARSSGRPGVPITKVAPGQEPASFTRHFIAWDSSKASAFKDPYLEKLRRLEEQGSLSPSSPAPRVDLKPVAKGSPPTAGEAPGAEPKAEVLLKKRSSLRPVDTPVAVDEPPAPAQARPSIRVPPDGSTRFTAAQLQAMKAEDGIDCTVKEKYLSDQEFVRVFGVERPVFETMPVWRQRDAKKRVGLF
uniref:Villin 1 n=1 Tax=Tetraselmis sp. GSL018 TaxID=582737 RepID=A0A061REH4_9CHLO